MKKFFLNIFLYLLIAAVVLIPLIVGYHRCLDFIIEIGGGSLILGTILTPFVIIGGINVFRGFCALLEKADQKYSFTKNWTVSLYLLIHIGGYLALFYMVAKLF